MRLVFDIEADNLLFDVTKIHCIVAKDVDTKEIYKFEPWDINEAVELLLKADLLIGHNIVGYDIPTLKKFYNFDYEGEIVDTLLLSKLRYPERKSHSLASWGETINFPKLEFKEFEDYTQEMMDYCVNDVELSFKVASVLMKRIDYRKDYVNLEKKVLEVQTASEQFGVSFDYNEAMKIYTKIYQEMDDIYQSVSDKLGYAYTTKAHKLKKDGTLSHHAVNLLNTLEKTYPELSPFNFKTEEGKSLISVPEKITLDTKKLLIEKLLELGWKPSMRTPKGSPKIADKGVVCENIPEEFSDVGKYYVLKHRKALLGGLFKIVRSDGKIASEADTLGAVTGRYTHRGIANFPAVRSLYGSEIRALFGVPDGYLQVGSDLSGIEARMLAHYMDDDEYTKEVLDGDIHTTNQNAAGLPTRDAAKTFFYGFLYGAGDEKVGSLVNGNATDGKKVKEKFLNNLPSLKRLIETKQKEAEKGYITSLDGRPVKITKSVGFDGVEQFDTRKALNSLLQSSATIYFKRWIVIIDELVKRNELDVHLMISYHDEGQWAVAPKDVEKFKAILNKAIVMADQEYQVKCPNACDIKVGKNWYDCH